MAFIKDLYRDELRSGWLVSSDVKKSWEKFLDMWQEIDRICHKYEINYWVYAGSLLGAARHGGFVPWDTDMDLCMMRADYNRFCDAAERELIRDDGLFEIGHRKFNNFRISMTGTTMLGKEHLHERDMNRPYGMMIEVYPLDVAPDGTPSGNPAIGKLLELLQCAGHKGYSLLEERVKNNQATLNEWTLIEKFHALSDKGKQALYNDYAEKLFNRSSAVAWIEDTIKAPQKVYAKDWFRETIYLPFESVKMPAPVDYDKVLTALYGDWHTPVYDNTFRIGSIYSPDIDYREFFKRVDLEFMFPPKETLEDATTQSASEGECKHGLHED